MAGSLNKVLLIGNLGRDPEVRFAPDGSKIVQISVATSDVWKDKVSGERKDRTEWHRVVVFNERLADMSEKYLKKGSKVFLEGQLQTRKWTDNMGQEKYTTEVVLSKFRGELVFLDSKNATSEDSHYDVAASVHGGGKTAEASPGRFDDLDDDIPF